MEEERNSGPVNPEFSGGNYWGPVYVGREFNLVQPRQPVPALRGLPRKSPVFTGRESKVDELLAVLEPDGSARDQSRVALVTGLPGVGKTELALQAAHAALGSGWFPGGALFIDMRGYDDERALTAAAALDGMLRAIGVPAEDIPPEEHRPRLFASRMAEYAAAGTPILVVIDNVADAGIAEALLPAAGATVVTSRHALAGLGAEPVDLEELSEPAAVELLARKLSRKGDTRVADHPVDALTIAGLCGMLPLALNIVGALLASHQAKPLSAMAEDLRDSRTRLDEMHYAKGGLAVRTAFDLSRRQLDEEQARVFRLFPLNFGQEVSTEAVAAMARLDVRTARRCLEDLEDAHLIRAGNSYGPHGRWRMHDLLRVYASGLPAEQQDLRAAFGELLFYYLDNARLAARLLDPSAVRGADGPFASRGQALEWLDAEYPNLAPFGHLVIGVPGLGEPFTADIALWLWRYLELRRHTDDWLQFTRLTLEIARVTGNRTREADALTKLGGALRQARRFDEAVTACRDAMAIQREVGNRHAEGIAMNNLVAALVEAKRYDEGITLAREAVAIFRKAGDRHREGIALSNLGGALIGTGKHQESVAAYEKAAAIFREAGDQRGESGVLTSLGTALRLGGRGLEESIDLHRQSAARMAEANDGHGSGLALVNLSAALVEAGQLDAAIAVARDAVALLRDSRDPHNLGSALVNLGMALLEAERSDEAANAFRDAVPAYHRSGDLDAEAETQISLGGALQKAGDLAAAIEVFRSAAAVCRATGNQHVQGHALGNLGYALWEARRSDEAVTTLRSALTASRTAGDLVGEAKSLMFLGLAFTRGRLDEAIAAFRDAAEILRHADDGKLAEVARGALQSAEAGKRARDELKSRLATGRFEDVIADHMASARLFNGRLAPRALTAIEHDVVGALSAELGGSLLKAGRFTQAVPILEEAVTAFREADEPDQERAARTELEVARKAQHDARAAADALGEALRSAGSGGQGNGRALQAALDEAYRHLGPHDARFFRLLAASPGPDISLQAAAILAVADGDGIVRRREELAGLAVSRRTQYLFHRMSDLYRNDEEIARGALRVLTQMRLVERDLASHERWRLPRAVRPFAAAQGRRHAKQDLREPARTLLHLYYLAGTHSASLPLDAGFFPPARPQQTQGLEWLASEYQNLVATVREAGDGDDLGAVIGLDLTRALYHAMSVFRQLDDAVELGSIARRAAQRLDDRQAEAVVLRNLGITLLQTGQAGEAVATLRDALAIYRDLGDLAGEGTTLTNLGSALMFEGQFTEAGTVLNTAIAIHRRRRNDFSEAVALSSLGTLLDKTGQLDQAITAFRDADMIYRKKNDQLHRSATLAQLAGTLRKAGHQEEAIKTYRRAAKLAELTGDMPRAAAVLTMLAQAYRAAGRQADADTTRLEIAELIPGTDDGVVDEPHPG